MVDATQGAVDVVVPQCAACFLPAGNTQLMLLVQPLQQAVLNGLQSCYSFSVPCYQVNVVFHFVLTYPPEICCCGVLLNAVTLFPSFVARS